MYNHLHIGTQYFPPGLMGQAKKENVISFCPVKLQVVDHEFDRAFDDIRSDELGLLPIGKKTPQKYPRRNSMVEIFF